MAIECIPKVRSPVGKASTIGIEISPTSPLIFTGDQKMRLIRAWIIPFYADTLCHAVTVTFDPLTLKVPGTSSVTWSNSVRNLSEKEQALAALLINLRIFAHVMSRCDRDLWPFDLELLQHFGCHAFKLCTKIERNRVIHGWVIDDLARFRSAILVGGVRLTGVRGRLLVAKFCNLVFRDSIRTNVLKRGTPCR